MVELYCKVTIGYHPSSTSKVKSTWPGVSTRLIVAAAHSSVTAADWIEIPRSRSASRKSVVVLPAST